MTAFARAVAHYDQGELAQSIPFFQQALAEEPDDVNVLYRAMLSLVPMGDYAGTARWLQEIIPHINPAQTPPRIMAGFYYNLGVALETLGQWEQADKAHRSALAFDPHAILPTIEVGTQCYRRGNHEEGKAWHDKALIPETVDVESRPARSFLKLLRGDYLGGFAEYESRWKLPQVLAKSYVPKGCFRWKGKPVNRLLVVGEQGIGDTILMSRYLPLVQELAAKVILVCHPALARLFRHNFSGIEVYTDRTKHPKCQWWTPAMSLPFVFGTTKETIPPVSLLSAPKSESPIDRRLFHVGYSANGNPLFMGDADRSAPDGAFQRFLLDADGVVFHDLSEAADRVRGGKDLADTASLVAQLDAVVSVDTSIAHLAGALGVTTFLIPMTSLHWLWGMHEPTSAWYPRTHRLFWRRTLGDWEGVLAQIRNALNETVGQRTTVVAG